MQPSRVLVADDDPAFRQLLGRVLVAAGHQIESCADGVSAVAMLDRQSYDLVVTDLAMPNLDGLQLLRAVRERDADLPVILLTGNPAVETAAKAVELRATQYLSKPPSLVVFRQAVAEAIEGYRIARLSRDAEAGHRAAKVTLGASFDRALATLHMAYQPIIKWSERRVFAYEALARPAEAGLDNPGRLFDAAERLARTADVGRVVRAQVAELAAESPGARFFVNLHPLDLLDEELYASESPLSRLAPRVCLEITERAAIEEISDAPTRVAALRGLGYQIAIDDLGAGYAGLSSVAQLEPEVVKLDMSLVRDVNLGGTKQRLIQAMIDLFGKMGRLVIAEGVETADEAATLVTLGCDLFQGYYFGRPTRELVASLAVSTR